MIWATLQRPECEVPEQGHVPAGCQIPNHWNGETRKTKSKDTPFSFTFELNDYRDGWKRGVFHGTLHKKISCIARR